MPYQDSAGRTIKAGDKVRWRGQNYEIAHFVDGEGRSNLARIVFTTEPHLDEIPDEFSVELLATSPRQHDPDNVWFAYTQGGEAQSNGEPVSANPYVGKQAQAWVAGYNGWELL